MSKLITVDLGSYAVKVAAYSGSGRKFELGERYSQLVPQDGGAPPTLEARWAALDALLDENGGLTGPENDVLVAFPSEFVTYHRISLPFTDPAQIETTLPFAVESDVPFDLEELLIRWRIVSTGDGAEVLACLVKKEHLRTWLEGLASRGLDPAALYVDGDLHGYWASENEPKPGSSEESAVAILDIGHTSTVVTVTRNGALEACRTVNAGGYHITTAIQRAMSCSWQEAETIKERAMRSEGSSETGVTPEARVAVDSMVGLLLSGVRACLVEMEDAHELSVDEVLVCGGGGTVDSIHGYLSQDLGVPVKRVADPNIQSVPLEFAVTHCLFQRAMDETNGQELDLRVEEFSYTGGGAFVRDILTHGSVMLGAFAAAILVLFPLHYSSLGKDLAEVDNASRDLVTTTFPTITEDMVQDGNMAVALMLESMNSVRQRAELLEGGIAGVPPTLDKLYRLTAAFPPHPDVTVDVSEIVLTPTNIRFDAETDGYASSATVEDSLKKTEDFKRVTKGEERKDSKDRIHFETEIPLEDVEEGEGEE